MPEVVYFIPGQGPVSIGWCDQVEKLIDPYTIKLVGWRPNPKPANSLDAVDSDKLLQLIGILVSRLGGGIVIDVVEAVKKFDVEFFQLPEDFAYGVRVKEK